MLKKEHGRRLLREVQHLRHKCSRNDVIVALRTALGDDANFPQKEMQALMQAPEAPVPYVAVSADWQMRGDPKRFERELKGFVWAGIGWYLTDTDTVLVVENGDGYIAYIWSCPFENTAFAKEYPTAEDRRS